MTKAIVVTLLLSLYMAACSAGRAAPDAGHQQDAQGPNKGPDVGGDTLPPSSADGAVAIATPGGSGPVLVVTGPALFSGALAQIKAYVREHGLPVLVPSVGDARRWFEEGKYFNWSKAERQAMQEQMASDDLSVGSTLTLEQIVALPGSPWRITLCRPPATVSGVAFTSCGTMVEGQSMVSWISQARSVCANPTRNLCDEPFVGPFASPDPVALSAEVEVRVEPIQVAGEPAVPELAQRDALRVSVKLSADSIPLLVDYFAVGYDRSALEARMRSLLGTAPSREVEVQQLMVGWIRDLANTFPKSGDNDVCHGPARLFYSDVLYNDQYDRSTEAVAVLLTDHYCQVSDDALPRFGDYLYNPGAHSARYILKDPASGRDVILSIQSGGISAYRFYWADEDMSGKPFGHQPMPDYRARLVDTWRRCR